MSALALRDLPEWPATLDALGVVAYSGLSESEVLRHARTGSLVFKPIGPHGRKVCPREQVDALLKSLWSDRAGSPLEDLDFGDD